MEKTVLQNHFIKYCDINELDAIFMVQDNWGHFDNGTSSMQSRLEGIIFRFLKKNTTDKI